MPNLIETFTSSPYKTRRYRIKATGEIGTGVASSNGGRNVGRLATIGDKLNISVIDLCLDATGEIRTFRADVVEQITEEEA
ncbi:hypothetical protein [Paenarthrobacter sp. NPDC058040]|uniref:hypothetical protein n=1 Tax=unclassified Paenarthrobacter TaxID=2634190 RepID=UPI0036D84528